MLKYLIITIILTITLHANELKESVTIIKFTSKGIDEVIASQITDALTSKLVETNMYRVVDRGEFETIMKEQNLQQTAVCSDESCIIEYGHILGVKKIVIGSIGKLENAYTLSIKLLNVETSEIITSKFYIHHGLLSELIEKRSSQIIKDIFAIQETKQSLNIKPKQITISNNSMLNDSKPKENIIRNPHLINTPNSNNKQNDNKIVKTVLQVSGGILAITGFYVSYSNNAIINEKYDEYKNIENGVDKSKTQVAYKSYLSEKNSRDGLVILGYTGVGIGLATAVTFTFVF